MPISHLLEGFQRIYDYFWVDEGHQPCLPPQIQAQVMRCLELGSQPLAGEWIWLDPGDSQGALGEGWDFLAHLLSALSHRTYSAVLGQPQAIGLCPSLTVLSNRESPSFPPQEVRKVKAPQLCVRVASHYQHAETRTRTWAQTRPNPGSATCQLGDLGQVLSLSFVICPVGETCPPHCGEGYVLIKHLSSS